jgi:hypothetical protein
MSRPLAILLPLALLAMSVTPSKAQTSSVRMPDALGAAFDPEAVGKGTLADYDFLVGTWSFHFQPRGTDGSYGPPQTGTWTVRKNHGGHLIEDVWHIDGSDDPTITFRVFDPNAERWRLMGTRTSRGTWDPGISWSDGDQRFVVQTFREALLARIRYFDIRPDHFLWRADVSQDEGRTWILDAWSMDVTRTGE